MNRFVWLTLSAAAVLLVLATPGATRAEDPPMTPAEDEGSDEIGSEDEQRARAHFQAGASYYEAGDYEEALSEFQRAHEISPRPELFYNLSLAHQQLGNMDQAIELLDRYLNEADDIPNRTNLERRLQNLRERQAQGENSTAEPSPTGETLTTPTEANASEAGGSTLPPPLTTANTSGETVEPRVEPSDGGVPLGAWIGWGVGAAGIIGGAIFGGLALADKSDIEGMPCAINDTCPDSVVNSMETKALVADILLFGVGIGGAAVGTLLFFLLNDDSGEAEQAGEWSIGPWVASHEGGASMRGSF